MKTLSLIEDRKETGKYVGTGHILFSKTIIVTDTIPEYIVATIIKRRETKGV
ncbi:MAG TPA: hypothetical protein PLO75_01010 [Thermotogota bacterium]|nr:hypothetical protein [Thermotogota bacterium]